MRKRKILAATLFSAVILGVLISLLTARQRHHPAAGPPERITFADSRQFVSALVYVADAKGFFREEGLELLFRESPSEKDSLQAVVEGTAQLAAVSSTPVVLNVLKGEEVCVIVTIADSDRYTRIVARKDRGISGPDDLAGKRIGVSIGTNAEFFLDMYLVFHGVPLKGVHLVDLRPGQLVDALLSGEVDAASLGDPFAGILESRLGSGSLVLSEEGIYKMNWNIAARKDFVHNNRGRIRKFLRALVKAESYSAKQHDETIRIASAYTRRDPSLMRSQMGGTSFAVSLGQSLLLNLEGQARWALRNRYAPGTKTPNFLSNLCAEGLEAVAPDAVGVVHP